MKVSVGQWERRRVVMVLVLGLGILSALVGYRVYEASRFTDAYEAYAHASDTHVQSAFLPGAPDNPVRQELNRMLVQSLAQETAVVDRLSFAQRGTNLLTDVERQIDAIGTNAETTEAAIGNMEAVAAGGVRKAIVALARERLAIVADIRGLSYRANYHTATIFDRIIKDGGKLTDAHVLELNDQIPAVEEQFDRRSNLYSDLESANFRMEKLTNELSSVY